MDFSALAGIVHATGGLGNDTFVLGSWSASDTVNGVSGDDTLVLDGSFAATSLTHTAVSNIANLTFAAGHSYHITTDSHFAATHVDGSALGASDSLYYSGGSNIMTGVTIIGGAGNDTLSYTVGKAYTTIHNTFDLSFGGDDTVTGGLAVDTFNYGAAYTPADSLNGGGGNDIVNLTGVYSSPITLGSNLKGVFEVNITTASADVVITGTPVAPEAYFFVNVYGSNIDYDASAETGATMSLDTTATTGTILGSSFRDYITVNADATDLSVDGGGGGNSLGLDVDPGQTSISSGLHLNGGDPADDNSLEILGSGNTITLTPTLFQNFDTLYVFDSAVTFEDADLAAGKTLTVGVEVSNASFDGSAETDGTFNFIDVVGTVIGGAGADTILGLDGSEALSGHITGGGGGDTITGGLVLNYDAVSDSTGAGYDTIEHFDFSGASGQVFHGTGLPTAINAAVTSGTLSTASFDADLAAAIAAGQLGAGHAVLFTPSAGSLAGQTFLIVDHNGVAGYQAGQDFVFHLVNDTNVSALNTGVFT